MSQRRRRQAPALAASPVLVGAVTVLVVVVAVFIAYNANSGLPFVPTYAVKAQLPSGNKLVPGNEVRVGGFRVGVVDEIKPKQVDGRTVAEVSMKLDKTVDPLARDTLVRIRPRSALGLQYLELSPGKAKRKLRAGDSLPLAQAREGEEIEDVLSTFDEPTRDNLRGSLDGFGPAFAGRGNSINTAIQAFNPLLRDLRPVMQTLNDPDTKLDRFFVELGGTVGQVAPVAREQAEMFGDMATTFEALDRDPQALQDTIAKSPPTLDTAVRSFRVTRPFLTDFTDLSRRLRPAVNELPRSLPPINSALRVGTPVLPRTVGLNDRLRKALIELDDLFLNPNTLLTIRDLRTTVAVVRPALEFIAPYQTVCSYSNYFLHALGEHQSQTTAGGTVQSQGVKLPNLLQANSLASTQSSRPVDTPPGVDPIGATDATGQALARQYSQPYQPAIDAQGNADCQIGQNGFVRGPLGDSRYGPGTTADGTPSGGNASVTQPNFPILSGGTFKARQLGIRNLKDVDKLR